MTDTSPTPEQVANAPPLDQTSTVAPLPALSEDAYYDWLFAKDEAQAAIAAAVFDREIEHDQALRGERQ